MIIRKLTLLDYEAADRLIQHLHDMHYEARPDLYIAKEHPYSLEEYEEKVTSENYITLAAEEDGEIIGVVFVKLVEKSLMVDMPIAQMNALCVDEAHQRKGIATKLFEESTRLAKEAGAKRLDLMVWGFNEKARAFYEKIGMKEQRRIMECEL